MDVLGLTSVSWWILCIVVVLVALYLYGYRKQTTFKRLGIAGPIGRPYVGQLGRITQIGVFCTDLELVLKHGKCFGACVGNIPTLFVTDLDMIKDICVKQFQIFPYRAQSIGFSKFWKLAMANSDGDHWKFLRSTLSPTFTTRKLRSMNSICKKCFSGFNESIGRELVNSDIVDFRKIFEGLTMDFICSTSMGIDVDSQMNPNSPFVESARKLMTVQLEKDPLIIATLLFPELQKILNILDIDFFDKGAVEFMKASMKKAIEERRTGGHTQYNDALQLMMNACKQGESKIQTPSSFEDYKERGMTEIEIVANSASFLVAGFDTTASTLMWMAYYLALNQDCQDKLFQEINSVIGSSQPSYDHLDGMEYLDMFMNETLRLNPAASRTSRQANQDTVIGKDVKVRKGMEVTLPIYALHRMAEYWPDPEKFDPERFSSKNKEFIQPYSYMPFGVGPRSCVGMRLAMMEVKLAISTLLQRYRLLVSTKTMIPMEYEANIFIKPKGEMWLKVQRR